MKALVFNGPGDIRYEDFADPILETPNTAIVQVRKCSICGSDLHIFHGSTIKEDYSAGVEKFCVGHEFIGEVVEVGTDVHGLNVGDQVLSSGEASCGRCQPCLTGSGRCEKSTAFGLNNSRNGGQAELVAVPMADRTLMPIPDGISDEHAMLLTDAMATAAYGIDRADIQPGTPVAVVGLGPIGLIGVELAFLRGASRVFAIDPVAERRAQATRLGAVALAPGPETAEMVVEATSGGVQSVFEASGAGPAVQSTLGFLRREATVSLVGLPPPSATLPVMDLLRKRVTLRAGIAPVSSMWAGLVPLLQEGRLKAENVFSHSLPLSQGRTAYDMFDRRENGVLKIMLEV